MNVKRAYITRFIIVCLFLAALTWVAAGSAADKAVLESIHERGVLQVGTTGDYIPMSYLDPQTDHYVGFDVDLAEDLAASLGVELEYVKTSWPTLMEDIQSEKFDLAVCGITITDERKKQALMSEGYLGNGKTVLCRAEDAGKYTSLEAINQPQVRVMENPGGLNEKFARENLPAANLIIHDVNQEIPELIASGKADVMITEIMEAGYYVGQDDRLAAPLIYEPFTRGELGALMPKGSEDLLQYVNEFLEEEKASGRLDALAEENIYRYVKEQNEEPKKDQNAAFDYREYPLKRNGISLHLDCMKMEGAQPEKNILLTHGVTYSSHEFDINYKDYSLVRFLAREGYAVWRLDIAGFGQSEEVEDGFMPDSDYAAEDINAAVEKIVSETGQDKIDVLGWSWGTVTAGRFAARHGEHIRKLVLYAPILSGIGKFEVTDAFHHNTWEHAADDFQRSEEGRFDYEVTDPIIIEAFCSGCWHYDGEQSPNGGRRDICVPKTKELIDLTKIEAPTLVICGDQDPYLNYELVKAAPKDLPEGSKLETIAGGSHVVYIEKPYYHDFQEKLISFLGKS